MYWEAIFLESIFMPLTIKFYANDKEEAMDHLKRLGIGKKAILSLKIVQDTKNDNNL